MERCGLVMVLVLTMLLLTGLYLSSSIAGVFGTLPGTVIWLMVTFRIAFICGADTMCARVCAFMPVVFIFAVLAVRVLLRVMHGVIVRRQ